MSSALFRRIIQRCYKLTRNVRKPAAKFSEELPEREITEEARPHTPVMVKEVIENLNLTEGSLFLDMTFGAGGHSKALLEQTPDLQIFALDRDPIAQRFAEELGEKYPGQVIFLEGKFSDLPNLLKNYEIYQSTFDGILFDLGCSSMQFDTAERGFSIFKNGPLDMRMDGGKAQGGLTAADVIAYATEKDLEQILKTYGGEKKAKKIARAIVQSRAKFKPLTTTRELADLVDIVFDQKKRFDKLERETSNATKVFQALRIFVNNEINELNYGLLLAHRYLKVTGRAAVLTFHSCEDEIVKKHFKNRLIENQNGPLPLIYYNLNKGYSSKEFIKFNEANWQAVKKKVIVPSKEEVMLNDRSRSAKLRVAIKINETKT